MRRFLLVAAGAFLAYGLGTAFIAWAGCHDQPGRADAALVLGCLVNPDGTPSADLRVRLDRAVELVREGSVRFVVVSGGRGREGWDEADVMAAYLAAHGVDPARIVPDHAGWTTWDSARNTALLLREREWKGVVVVTEFFHVPRAAYALRRFGVEPVFTAHARYLKPHHAFLLARETAGWLVYPFKSYRL